MRDPGKLGGERMRWGAEAQSGADCLGWPCWVSEGQRPSVGSQSKRSFLRASWRLLNLGTKSGRREKEPEEAKHAERRAEFMVGPRTRYVWTRAEMEGSEGTGQRKISGEDLRSHP